jgi:type III secretory pathway component EscT
VGTLDEALLAQGLAVGLLLCLRLAPSAWLVPWACVRGAPGSVPLALIGLLTVCLWPVAAVAAPRLPLGLPALLGLGLRELLIGLVYALGLALPLRALEWAGWLQGRFAGIPGAEQTYASLQLWLALVAFFALGGHRLATLALADGLIRHPIGVLSPAGDVAALALGSARLVADAVASALLLALPVAAAAGMAELGWSVVARVASVPALPAALVPVRAALAMFVVCIGALVLFESYAGLFRQGLAAARRVWEAL